MLVMMAEVSFHGFLCRPFNVICLVFVCVCVCVVCMSWVFVYATSPLIWHNESLKRFCIFFFVFLKFIFFYYLCFTCLNIYYGTVFFCFVLLGNPYNLYSVVFLLFSSSLWDFQKGSKGGGEIGISIYSICFFFFFVIYRYSYIYLYLYIILLSLLFIYIIIIIIIIWLFLCLKN